MAKIYTYKNLQDEVLYWLDEAGTSGTTLTNVKNALQQAHLDRLTERDWNFMLWPVPVTFATVSGTQAYALHSDYYKPFYFYNQTTKAYMTEVLGRQLGPSGAKWNTDTGPASRFSMWGRSPVQAQPVAAAVVTVVSTSASDTGTVTIKGTDSTGNYTISETLTLSGTTPVVGTKTFSNPVLNLTLSAACVGTLTVTCGVTTLVVLQPGELGRSYPLLYLLSNPTSASTVEYRFYRQPSVLSADNDIPDLPPPFQQLLVWDTLLSMIAYNSDLNAAHIAVWREKRDKLAQSLQDFDEGGSLEAEPRYVRTMDFDDDGALPRVYR